VQERLKNNVPRTLDNTREFDPSILTANPAAGPSTSTAEGSSQQVAQDENSFDISTDPFASYFTSSDPSVPPKVLITTSKKVTRVTYEFCDELVGVFPGAEFIRRKKGKGFEIGRIAGWAAGRGYGALVVVNEDTKKPSKLLEFPHARGGSNGLHFPDAITVVHLPSGPTAYFKLTSIELTQQIFVRISLSPFLRFHSPTPIDRVMRERALTIPN
jgi:ribosome production factor 1